MDNYDILWVDTISFGFTSLTFLNPDENYGFSSFTLNSENTRDLYGLWNLINNNDSIVVKSIASSYMSEDTLINGHRYTFHNLIDLKFKVKSKLNHN